FGCDETGDWKSAFSIKSLICVLSVMSLPHTYVRLWYSASSRIRASFGIKILGVPAIVAVIFPCNLKPKLKSACFIKSIQVGAFTKKRTLFSIYRGSDILDG